MTDIRKIQRSGVGIGGMWKHPPLWVATIKDQGTDWVLSVSQLLDEDKWYVDSCFNMSNMYPHFCHGEGARGLAKQVIIEENVVAYLKLKQEQWGDKIEEVHGL